MMQILLCAHPTTKCKTPGWDGMREEAEVSKNWKSNCERKAKSKDYEINASTFNENV